MGYGIQPIFTVLSPTYDTSQGPHVLLWLPLVSRVLYALSYGKPGLILILSCSWKIALFPLIIFPEGMGRDVPEKVKAVEKEGTALSQPCHALDTLNHLHSMPLGSLSLPIGFSFYLCIFSFYLTYTDSHFLVPSSFHPISP